MRPGAAEGSAREVPSTASQGADRNTPTPGGCAKIEFFATGFQLRAAFAAIFAVVFAGLAAGCSPFPQHLPSSQATTSTTPSTIGAGGSCGPRPNQAGTSYVVYGHRYHVLADATGYEQRGIASWYGPHFHGKLTSSGTRYDMYGMTGASKVLPLCTWVKVTNLQNGSNAIVQINDRGPFVKNRIIDLSYNAAKQIDMLAHGTALVDLRAIAPPSRKAPSNLVSVSQSHPVAPLHHRPLLYIQLGAFLEPANAERLRARLLLNEVGQVTITTARVKNRLFYRVLIGPLGTVESVDALTAHLDRLGFHERTEVVIQ